jgi:hypothetical protein
VVFVVVSGFLSCMGTAIAFFMGMLMPAHARTPAHVDANRSAVVRTATVNTPRPVPPHEIGLRSGARAAMHDAPRAGLTGRSSYRTGRYILEIDDADANNLMREEGPGPDPDEDLGTALGDDPDPDADADDNAGLDEDFFSDGDSPRDAHPIDEEDAYDIHFFE